MEIHASAPRWAEQDQVTTMRVTLVNNRISYKTVRIDIQSLYDYIEILYPADKYVVAEMPPRGSYALDVSARGVREGEEHISINAAEVNCHGFPLRNAFIVKELLKVTVFPRPSSRSIKE